MVTKVIKMKPYKGETITITHKTGNRNHAQKMTVAFSLSQQTLNHKCAETRKLPPGKCGFALKYKLLGLKKKINSLTKAHNTPELS